MVLSSVLSTSLLGQISLIGTRSYGLYHHILHLASLFLSTGGLDKVHTPRRMLKSVYSKDPSKSSMKALFLVLGLGMLWATCPLKVNDEGASVFTRGRALTMRVIKGVEAELYSRLLPQTKFLTGSCPTRGLSSAVFSLLYMPTVPNLRLPRRYSPCIPNMLFFSIMSRGAYS